MLGRIPLFVPHFCFSQTSVTIPIFRTPFEVIHFQNIHICNFFFFYYGFHIYITICPPIGPKLAKLPSSASQKYRSLTVHSTKAFVFSFVLFFAKKKRKKKITFYDGDPIRQITSKGMIASSFYVCFGRLFVFPAYKPSPLCIVWTL